MRAVIAVQTAHGARCGGTAKRRRDTRFHTLLGAALGAAAPAALGAEGFFASFFSALLVPSALLARPTAGMGAASARRSRSDLA